MAGGACRRLKATGPSSSSSSAATAVHPLPLPWMPPLLPRRGKRRDAALPGADRVSGVRGGVRSRLQPGEGSWRESLCRDACHACGSLACRTWSFQCT